MRKLLSEHLDKIEKQTAMIISCAHNAARVAMNRAVEFVLIVMFGASVLYR
jgi:hypothetical protein